MYKWNRIIKYTIIQLLVFSHGIIIYAQNSSQDVDKIGILNRLINEVYNGRNFEVINDIVAPDYIEYTNSVRTESSNIIKETVMFLLKTAPDFQLTPIEIITKGDKVVLLWKYQGNNDKYGKEVNLEGVYIAKFKEGKIIEGWLIFDNYSRFKQLGYNMIPPAAATEK